MFNQEPAFAESLGNGLERLRSQGLLYFYRKLSPLRFLSDLLRFAPTNCPWISEDTVNRALKMRRFENLFTPSLTFTCIDNIKSECFGIIFILAQFTYKIYVIYSYIMSHLINLNNIIISIHKILTQKTKSMQDTTFIKRLLFN